MVARNRSPYTGFAAVRDRFITQPIAFLKEQKMLREVRVRAEAM